MVFDNWVVPKLEKLRTKCLHRMLMLLFGVQERKEKCEIGSAHEDLTISLFNLNDAVAFHHINGIFALPSSTKGNTGTLHVFIYSLVVEGNTISMHGVLHVRLCMIALARYSL